MGVGRAGIVALHAAAMNPGLFESVTLRETPRDWASIVRDNNPDGQLEATVHGSLQLYDLPDLVTVIGEDKVSFLD